MLQLLSRGVSKFNKFIKNILGLASKPKIITILQPSHNSINSLKVDLITGLITDASDESDNNYAFNKTQQTKINIEPYADDYQAILIPAHILLNLTYEDKNHLTNKEFNEFLNTELSKILPIKKAAYDFTAVNNPQSTHKTWHIQITNQKQIAEYYYDKNNNMVAIISILQARANFIKQVVFAPNNCLLFIDLWEDNYHLSCFYYADNNINCHQITAIEPQTAIQKFNQWHNKQNNSAIILCEQLSQQLYMQWQPENQTIENISKLNLTTQQLHNLNIALWATPLSATNKQNVNKMPSLFGCLLALQNKIDQLKTKLKNTKT